MDPRTGLGRFRDFRISNYQLMMQLIDDCTRADRSRRSSQTPDVAERVELYRDAQSAAAEQIRAAPRCTATSWCSTCATRRSSTPPTASWSTRCSPRRNISIHVLWGLKQQNTVFATGKSIIDRSLADRTSAS